MLGRKAAGVAGSRSTPAGTAAEATTGIERQGVAGAEGERGLLIAALYARVSTYCPRTADRGLRPLLHVSRVPPIKGCRPSR